MRSPRVRFTMRRMMILLLIIGGVLGWIVHREHVQQDAVRAILRAGGAVLYDSQYKDLGRVADGVPGGTTRSARALGPPYGWLRALGPPYFGAVTDVTLT